MSITQPPMSQTPYYPDPGNPDQPSRRRGLIRLMAFFGVLIVLFGAGLLYVRSVSNGDEGPSKPVSLVVPQGASTGQIAGLLSSKSVIRNAWLFKALARLDGRAAALKPGRYELRTGMAFGEVLDVLESGPKIESTSFTIPEGKLVPEVVDIIRRKTKLSAARFQAEIDSGRYRLPIMPAGSKNLEGVLFPKTYRIVEGATEAQVLQLLLNQFTEETSGLDFGKAPQKLTPYQVLILASLVEREAKVPEDRAKIAGVIYNRLRRGMRLQIDATVQYAIYKSTGAYKSRLTFADYEISSPYNTYQIDRLPPAPIASPGLASLQAAVAPATTDAIFYVLCDKRGAHAFARTADEFSALKRECAAKR